MTAADAWVFLARIRRTQGRRGEVFADILTDFPEKFAERRRLWLLNEAAPERAGASTVARAASSREQREMELVHHWFHKGGVVLQFAGVDSISAAEELKGTMVAIPRSERAALEEGDIYVGDLIGCTVVDVAGEEPVVIGEIEDVDRSGGPVAMLVLRAASRRAGDDEILIPFAKEYLRRVDVEAKRIEMVLPEGLVKLNER
jgi:16S rRNA processing protein RimM